MTTATVLASVALFVAGLGLVCLTFVLAIFGGPVAVVPVSACYLAFATSVGLARFRPWSRIFAVGVALSGVVAVAPWATAPAEVCFVATSALVAISMTAPHVRRVFTDPATAGYMTEACPGRRSGMFCVGLGALLSLAGTVLAIVVKDSSIGFALQCITIAGIAGTTTFFAARALMIRP